MLPKCFWHSKQQGLDASIFQYTQTGHLPHRMCGYVCNLSPLRIALTSEFCKPSKLDHNRIYSRTVIFVQLCANYEATILKKEFIGSSDWLSPHCMRLHGLCSWWKGYIMAFRVSILIIAIANSNSSSSSSSNSNK